MSRAVDAAMPPSDPSLTGAAASNTFTAELGLLTKLVAPRVSHAKEDQSLLAPKPVSDTGKKKRSVPPLNDMETAVGEVQTLPTHGKMRLGVSSTNHEGIKEMLIGRKARHEAAVEAFKKKLGTMEVELEARTAHVARSFKQLMALNDAELQTMFDELADDFLLVMEMDEVDSAWVRIDEELGRRAQWVNQFERDLGRVEDERREMIESEMTTLLEALVNTAHLLPPQLERFVENETHQVNLLILANREAHADLIAKLRVDDVKRHKASRAEWEARKLAWRRLRHDHAILTLKSYLHSPEVIAPAQQAATLHALGESQATFQERRVATTAQLADLAPPGLTAAEAAKIRAALEELLLEEATSAARAIRALQQAEAEVAEEVAGATAYLMARLHHFAADPPEVLQKIHDTQILPLCELRTEQAADLIERVTRAETRQRLKLHEDALALTANFEGAGRIFDGHFAQASALYHALRAALHACRETHELLDKKTELQLEECLMAMRRAADKDELMGKQEEAMALLYAIQIAYREFHGQSLVIVQAHPSVVRAETDRLQSELLDFHHLKTAEEYEESKGADADASADVGDDDAAAAPEAGTPSKDNGGGQVDAAPADGDAAAEAPAEAPAGAVEGALEGTALEGTRVLVPEGEQDLWATFGLTYDARMEAQIALDDEREGLEAALRVVPPPDPYALRTEGGVGYQMLTPDEVEAETARLAAEKLAAAKAAAIAAAEAEGKDPPVDADDDDAAEGAEGGDGAATRRLDTLAGMEPLERAKMLLPTTYAGQPCLVPLVAPVDISVRVDLAAACLSYHEKHAAAMAERAAHEAKTLEKQLTRELDERLMAHRPRAGHVETDMAATRDMELLSHRERFVRHVKTLTSRRAALAERLDARLVEAREAETAHMAKLSTVQRALRSERNNHTATLQRLSREAEAAHATYLKLMGESFDGLKKLAKQTRGEVLSANGKFRDSWVVFMEGGHFNPTERERFVARLAKVDEDAESEAAKQLERLGGLRETMDATAVEALEAFRADYAVNLEDITHIEGLKMQQGKATADVRIVLAESAAQQAAIEAEASALEKLLRKKEGSGGSGGSGSRGGSSAGGSDDDALSMRILRSVATLRELLLKRGRFLAPCIASEARPSTGVPVTADPPAEASDDAEAAAAAAADDDGVREAPTMRELVVAARDKHEAEMMTFCEEYHAHRGERPVTRPSLIPPNAEEHKEKIKAMLTATQTKAEAECEASIRTLRLQLLTIWRLLNLVGPAVFDDIASTARATASKVCLDLAEAHAPLARDRARKREVHREALKPTLRNAALQAELKALVHAEADRSRASTTAALGLKDGMIATETEQAGVVVRRLLHQSQSMLGLLDAIVAQEDLKPADDPPEDVHHVIKKKMRMETRDLALDSTADEPIEGRPFMVHTWPGLPLGELTPEAVSAALDPQVAADAPAQAEAATKEDGGDGGNGASTSPELRSIMSRAHRSVISARDRVYAAYKLHYAARAREIQATCDAALQEERQWTVNWKKLVDRCAIDPIPTDEEEPAGDAPAEAEA